MRRFRIFCLTLLTLVCLGGFAAAAEIPEGVQLDITVAEELYAGKAGLAVELGVDSGAGEVSMLTVSLVYDKTLLELVDTAGKAVELPTVGRVRNGAQLTGYPDFEFSDDLFAASLGDKLGGIAFARVSLEKSLKLSGVTVGKAFLALKSGADITKAAESIRVATYEEARTLRQGCGVYYMDGNLDSFILAGASDETPAFSKCVNISVTGHKEVVDAAVAPTCTESGKTEGKHCSVCNAVLVPQQVVPAKGHTEVIDKAVAATCISGLSISVILAIASSFANKHGFFLPSLFLAHNARGQGCLLALDPKA